MVMNEQTNDICTNFIKHLLGHGGSYTDDVFKIELVLIAVTIMAHLPPSHQLQHVPLNKSVILPN